MVVRRTDRSREPIDLPILKKGDALTVDGQEDVSQRRDWGLIRSGVVNTCFGRQGAPERTLNPIKRWCCCLRQGALNPKEQVTVIHDLDSSAGLLGLRGKISLFTVAKEKR